VEDDPGRTCPFWDWDAAVLVRNLERLGPAGRRQAVGCMPLLLGHADERVRTLARDTLQEWGEVPVLAQVLLLLDEPRAEGAAAAASLLAALDLDRVEELAIQGLRLAAPPPASLAWAVDQAGRAFPFATEEAALLDHLRRAAGQAVVVRRALARLAARWEHPTAAACLPDLLHDADPGVRLEALRGVSQRKDIRVSAADLRRLAADEPAIRAEVAVAAVRQGDVPELIEALAGDPDAGVRARLAECLAECAQDAAAHLARLQDDPHPRVRAAALTPARAAELVRAPERESSWSVLARAARLARVPLWNLEPEPWRPAPPSGAAPGPLQLLRGSPPNARLLGPEKLAVAPLGLSGHYGLPVEGFVRGVEAGVNLLFWEPNYQTLTAFAARLPPSERRALHFMTGTFEADGKRVRRDAERALRLLGIDRLAVYLVFWVQSWARITPDVREALERLEAEGKVGAFGLSTHDRPLALEALAAGWDPVMVRHSAAHRGAEAEVFPRARALGTTLLTFSNTCYGRLLQARPGLSPPTAADCYRYALDQPGVAVCLSAPATVEQLEENLVALGDPMLPKDRRALLLAQGASLYEDETVFRRLVRSR
jgi:hypothetical protein